MFVHPSRLREVICSRGDAGTRRLQAAEGSLFLSTVPLATKFIEGASHRFEQLLRASASPREHFSILRERI